MLLYTEEVVRSGFIRKKHSEYENSDCLNSFTICSQFILFHAAVVTCEMKLLLKNLKLF